MGAVGVVFVGFISGTGLGGWVWAIFFEFVVAEDAEGFAGEVGAVEVGGVEDVTQFVAGEAVEFGVVGIKFGADLGASVFVPDEGGKGEGSGVEEWGSGGVGEWAAKTPLSPLLPPSTTPPKTNCSADTE